MELESIYNNMVIIKKPHLGLVGIVENKHLQLLSSVKMSLNLFLCIIEDH